MVATSDISSKESHWDKGIVIKYSLLIALGLVAYFGLMFALGYGYVTELRYFNFFFVISGVGLGLKEFFSKYNSDKTSYFSGLSMGVAIASLAAFIFTISFYVLFKLIFPAGGQIFVDSIEMNTINLEIIAIIMMMEGVMSGLTSAFIIMQFYK